MFSMDQGLDPFGSALFAPEGYDPAGQDFYHEYKVQQTPCCDPFMSESAMLPHEPSWLEEEANLTELIRHEALSPSIASDDGSSNPGTPPDDAPIKSPREIFEEISREASQFEPAATPPSCEAAPTLAQLQNVQLFEETVHASHPAKEEVPAAGHLGQIQEYVTVVSEESVSDHVMVTADPLPEVTVVTGPEQPHEMTTDEIQEIMAAQVPYMMEQGISQSNVQVLMILGQNFTLPGGTKVVLAQPMAANGSQRLGSSSCGVSGDAAAQSAADALEEEGAPAKKKRVYGKGGYERKKEQNRVSAQKYRSKVKKQKDSMMTRYVAASSRNGELKARVEDLVKEIDYWKGFLAELQ